MAYFTYLSSKLGIIKIVESEIIAIMLVLVFFLVVGNFSAAGGYAIVAPIVDTGSFLMLVVLIINIVFICLHVWMAWSEPCLEFIHAIVASIVCGISAALLSAWSSRCINYCWRAHAHYPDDPCACILITIDMIFAWVVTVLFAIDVYYLNKQRTVSTG